jgi:Cof subfamily protein (haloacid dehalogenase superfamily)
MSAMLVAIDVDGTLVGESLKIGDADRTAIEAAEAGNLICLASGRLFAASRPFAESLHLSGPIIALQGAVAYEVASGKRLFCTPLDPNVALAAYDDLKERGFHLQLYYGDRLYLDELNDAAQYYLKISRVQPVVVSNLRELLTEHPPKEPGPIKLLGIATAALVERTIPELARHLGEHANVFRSMPVFLEVTDPLATKGEALRRIAELYGFEMSATAAIGDSDNDVPMFEAAAVSFAVAHASDAAKRAATHVVGPLGSGVAQALGMLGLTVAREPA